MAAFVASDVTLTITSTIMIASRRFVIGTLTFGDGSLTYPTAGIPLPAIGSFGFKVACLALIVFGVNARTTEYLAQYNPAAHKLQLFEEEAAAAGGPLLEADTSEAPAARTYSFLAIGY